MLFFLMHLHFELYGISIFLDTEICGNVVGNFLTVDGNYIRVFCRPLQNQCSSGRWWKIDVNCKGHECYKMFDQHLWFKDI